MKKNTKISIISIAVVLVLVIALSCVLVACNKNPGENNDTKTSTPTSVVTLDINPSIELVLDENNMVMKATAENTDAQILLQGADGVQNVDVALSVQNIGDLAVKMNYVEENSSINISVVGSSNVDVAAIKANVKASFEAATAALKTTVEEGLDMAIVYEIKAVKKAYPELKIDENKPEDVARYRLMRSAMVAKIGLTFSEADKMTNEELIQIVNDAKATLKANVDNSTKELYEQTIVAYTNAKDVLNSFAYPIATAINPQNNIKAYKYLSLHIQELCMKQAYDVAKEYFLDKEFTDAQIKALAPKLFDEKADQDAFIANSKDKATGKYTKSSVMHYIDMKYRRMGETQRQALEAKYAAAVDDIEEDLTKEYTFDQKTSFDGFESSISVTFKGNQLIANAFSTAANTIGKAFANPVNQTPFEYEKAIAEKEEAAKTTLTDLQNNMTDNGKQAVIDFQTNVNGIIKAAEDAYSNATKQFEEAADTWLKQQQAIKEAEVKA